MGLIFMPMQSTTNPLTCQLFLNVFSATLQGSLSLAQHALLRHFAFLQCLLPNRSALHNLCESSVIYEYLEG